METFKRKRVGQTAVSDNQSSSVTLNEVAKKAFIKNLVQIGTAVSEKKFEFCYVHDLGPRTRNDLDLQYSHTFIYSIRCLLLLLFRSLAAIVSENSTVFNFSYRKA